MAPKSNEFMRATGMETKGMEWVMSATKMGISIRENF